MVVELLFNFEHLSHFHLDTYFAVQNIQISISIGQ